MRILIFTTAYKPFVGGSELAIENLARHLPDISFDILTPRVREDLPSVESDGNTTIYRVGSGTWADKWLFPILGLFKALAMLRKAPYDLMHAYQASQGAGAAFLVKLFLPRVPLLVTLQEGKDLPKQNPVIRIFRRFIIERADHATVISDYLRRFILSIRTDLPVTLIPNGVDVERFSQPVPSDFVHETRSRFGISADAHVIVSASRLVEKNGVANLIRSLPFIRTGKPVHLLLIGDGPLRERLTALARDTNVADRVHFAGTIKHAHLHQYLVVGNVFVRPSRSEGLGSAFLEAMAAGLPVVASHVGGIPDFIKDGETGLFADPDDPASIAHEVELVLTDDVLRQKFIANGPTLVRERYRWSAVADAMRAVYTKTART